MPIKNIMYITSLNCLFNVFNITLECLMYKFIIIDTEKPGEHVPLALALSNCLSRLFERVFLYPDKSGNPTYT